VSILSKIKTVDFARKLYYQVQHPKTQIVLHHTVSGVGVGGDLATWRQNADRIATCLIIHHDGTPYQCFSSRNWAHHLGVKQKIFEAYGFTNNAARNVKLNQCSVAVEIDSAGGLKLDGGGWKSSFNTYIPDDRVIEYPDRYRGFYAFEKYTDAQIESLRKLLLYWRDNTYTDIPYTYRGDIWDVSGAALAGEPGVYTHVSFRPDKSDCHPQPELIQMLESL